MKTCVDFFEPRLKRPCRCGGTHFVEPKMKRIDCRPKGCHPCHGCRCCCDCHKVVCDEHPCCGCA